MIDRRAVLITGVAAFAAAPFASSAGEGGGRPAFGRSGKERPRVETMSAERAYEMAKSGDLVLIDVRPGAAWPTVGVPQLAEPLDFSDPMFWDVLDVITEGDKSVPVALICWTGGRSLHVAEAMKERGYRRAIDVGEGIRGSKDGPGWIAKGLPMDDYSGG